MEEVHFVKCDPEWPSNTEELPNFEPDVHLRSGDLVEIKVEPDRISDHPSDDDDDDDISKSVKGNLLTQEVKEEPDGDSDFDCGALANDAEGCLIIGEPAVDSQQSEVQQLNSPLIPYNSLESSSSACNEVNAERDRLEGLTGLHIKNNYSCENTSNTPRNLKQHGGHTGEKPHMFDLSGFSAKKKSVFQTHLMVCKKLLTIPKPYSCNQCNSSFGTNIGFSKHELVCKKLSEPCCCIELGISCSQKSCNNNLIGHSSKSSESFICTVCGKCFQKYSHLKQHIAYHSDDRPFTCSECGQSFKCRKDIVNHLNIHSNIKKYVCDVCGMGFWRNWNLNQHKRTHSEDRPFNCNDCGKAFKSRKEIVHHLVKHSNARPLICDVCGFAAKRHIELALHKTSHSDEEPFLCLTCGKSFKHQRYLNDHRRAHRKGSPKLLLHSCTLCGKTCKTLHNLSVHMRVHRPQ